MEFHPLANIFPLMEGPALDALAADIGENGIREPLIMFEDMLLDGRNRWNASQIAGVTITAKNIKQFNPSKDGDPKAWVISKNLQRRHLDESQRAMVMARLAKLPKGTHPPIGGSEQTQDEGARLLNVSVRSGQRARIVLESGEPELVHAVDQGHIAVSLAAKAARLPAEQQREIAARAEEGQSSAVRRVVAGERIEDPLAAIKRFAKFCGSTAAETTAAQIPPEQSDSLRACIETIDRWMDAFVPLVPERQQPEQEQQAEVARDA